jgi:hypothetical protein
LLIKTFLAASGLIPSRKKDSLAPGVECKGDAPFSVSGAETQLLHIRVPGTV